MMAVNNENVTNANPLRCLTSYLFGPLFFVSGLASLVESITKIGGFLGDLADAYQFVVRGAFGWLASLFGLVVPEWFQDYSVIGGLYMFSASARDVAVWRFGTPNIDDTWPVLWFGPPWTYRAMKVLAKIVAIILWPIPFFYLFRDASHYLLTPGDDRPPEYLRYIEASEPEEIEAYHRELDAWKERHPNLVPIYTRTAVEHLQWLGAILLLFILCVILNQTWIN